MPRDRVHRPATGPRPRDRPRHRALLAPVLLCFLASGASRTQAEAPGAALGALLAAGDVDPLELARVAARFGDAAIIALLSRPTQVASCLGAVRATPFLTSPELALPALATLSGGRDSLLAPAAARAALAIARQLDADALARRERLPVELAAARARLLEVAARGSASPDIAASAAAAAEQLRGAGIP